MVYQTLSLSLCLSVFLSLSSSSSSFTSLLSLILSLFLMWQTIEDTRKREGWRRRNEEPLFLSQVGKGENRERERESGRERNDPGLFSSHPFRRPFVAESSLFLSLSLWILFFSLPQMMGFGSRLVIKQCRQVRYTITTGAIKERGLFFSWTARKRERGRGRERGRESFYSSRRVSFFYS